MDSAQGKGKSESSAEWKKDSIKELLKVFLSTSSTASPAVDLQPFTPAVEGVLDMALTAMEGRVRAYAELCADRVRRDNDFDVKAADTMLQELEISHSSHLEGRLTAQGGSPGPRLGNPGNLHLQALDECFPILIRGVMPKQTFLLDAMLEENLLSTLQYESLRVEPDRNVNVEIFRMTRGLSQSDFETRFLPLLRRDPGNAIFAGQLSVALKRLESDPGPLVHSGCDVCLLRDRVDPRHLAERLVNLRLIPWNLHGDIRKRTMPTYQMWDRIFGHLGDPQKLLPVLKEKYPAVHADMARSRIASLQCQCLVPNRELPDGRVTRLEGDVHGDAASSDSAPSMAAEGLILPEYKMTSSRRGCCLLVVNDTVSDKSVSISTLDMTTKTAKVLHDLFLRLSFDVTDRLNLSAAQLKEELKTIAQTDHSSFDCVAIVFLIPPGQEDTILCSDGTSVSMSEVREYFRASRCPSLAGKPKIVYRAFSRGYRDQRGIRVEDERGTVSYIEDDADFLVIETCPPGCKTSRDGDSMVVDHVQLLAKVLDSHGQDQDLLALLTMVNNELSEVRTAQGIYITAPVHSTLKRKLKFPKLS